MSHFYRFLCAAILSMPLGVHAELLFVPSSKVPAAEAHNLAANASWVEDYGSFKVYQIGDAAGNADTSARPEGSWTLPEPNKLLLEAVTIHTDQAQTSATSLEALATYAGGGIFKLVQFRGPIKGQWLDSLRTAGIILVSYIPDFAYLVAVPAGTSADFSKIESVRWVGDYLPEYRLQPTISRKLASGSGEASRFVVQVAHVSDDSVTSAKTLLTARGAKILSQGSMNGFDNLRIEISAPLAASVALIPDVIWIEEDPNFELHGERGAQIAAGAFTPGPPLPTCTTPGYASFLSSHNLGGSGFTVQVIDSGLDKGIATNLPGTAHADILGRIIGIFNATSDASGSDLDGHGTINAGIVMGNATLGVVDVNGFKLGQGVAPLATVYSTKIFRSAGPFDIGANTITSLMTNAMQSGATFSTNSWGSNAAGDYTATSQEFDFRVRDGNTATAGNQALTITVSAGNAGDDTVSGVQSIGSPATAKNVIAVGAGENCDANGTDGCSTPPAEADSLSDVVEFSSRGPTNDSRIGVTIIATGTHVNGPASTAPGYDGSGVCDQYFPGAQTDYARSSGTSHSCPITAGAAVLLSEFYSENVLVPFGGLGGVTPSPAMVKAMMIAGADDMFGGANGKGGTLLHHPEPIQGWGRLNMKNIVDNVDSMVFRDQQDNNLLTFTGQEETFSVFPMDGAQTLRVVLVWTDVPSNPAVLNTLVNNLDLEVVSDGVTYKGNVFSNGLAVAGGSADSINNIEAVFLPNPSGECQIRVRATNLAGDGVPGNGFALDQDFAVVVSNAGTQSSKGIIYLDRGVYRCGETLRITVSDGDLHGAGTATAVIQTSGSDAEVVNLTEAPADSGIFGGTIPMHSNVIVPLNGLVDIQAGHTIMVSYQDADDGTGNSVWASDSATVDCAAPEISNVQITSLGFDRITVTWTTSEAADSGLSVGPNCGPFIYSTSSPAQVTNHSLTLTGLQSCTDYFFMVYGADVLGNSDASACMPFRTLSPLDIFADDQEPTPNPGWTHNAGSGTDDWATVNYFAASSPINVWFSSDVSTVKDARLVTPALNLDATSILTFTHTYALETGFDGAVIEISTNGGSVWQDLGPYITAGTGYTHTIPTNYASPIGARQAWSGGTLGTMNQVTVSVGAFAGSGRLIRFRIACDNTVGATGWAIDDIVIRGSGPCPNAVESRGWTLYE